VVCLGSLAALESRVDHDNDPRVKVGELVFMMCRIFSSDSSKMQSIHGADTVFSAA
jgi:hypothetical protein